MTVLRYWLRDRRLVELQATPIADAAPPTDRPALAQPGRCCRHRRRDRRHRTRRRSISFSISRRAATASWACRARMIRVRASRGPRGAADEIGIEQVHVGAGLQPQPFDDPQQGRLAGDGVEREVELADVLAVRRAVAAAARRGDGRGRCGAVRRSAAGRRPAAALSAASPSSAIRMSRSSRILSPGSSAARGPIGWAASRRRPRRPGGASASRTGVRLTPSAPAMKRKVSFWPGAKRPVVNASRSES